MLQIRLRRGSSGDGGEAATPSSLPPETVTVACPDHLVLADLPVAKSLGAVTSSAASSVRSVGRRSRRIPGEKVHFCFRCDFPIAIYGRLIPCEHAFCLACARSLSSCYVCEERIQKIQTIKMAEGTLLLCGSTSCLKSFLNKSDFKSHFADVHPHHLPDAEMMEGGNEAADTANTASRQSSQQPESSTALAPGSNSQLQDRRHLSRDQPPPPQLRLPPYHSQLQPQNSESPSGPQQRRDPPQAPNYSHPMKVEQAPTPPPSFSYPHFSVDGSQPYYSAPEQVSVLGVPPWGMPPFPPRNVGQGGMPDGYMAPPFQGMPVNTEQQSGSTEPLPPQLPPQQPALLPHQLSSSNFNSGGVGREGPAYGWQNDGRGFGNGPE